MKLMRTLFFVLLVLFVIGCGPSATDEQTWNDAVDAIDRLKEFKTVDTEIDAKRLLQKVEHTSSLSDRYSLLLKYYLATDLAVRIGDNASIERSDVCGQEVRGRTLASHQTGDCQKLQDEYHAAISKSLQEKH
jgi:hypothetical protein